MPAEAKPVHGNYAHYYGMRTASAAARARRASGGAAPLSDLVAAGATDERVAALLSWLHRESGADHAWRVERVLDVGCNAAKPLIELCQALEPPPTRAVGVDIDPALVQQARHALRLAWCEREPADGVAAPQPHHFPASFPALFGTLPYPPIEPGVFPHNLAFYEADWVHADRQHAGGAPAERRSAPEEPHDETLVDEEREGFDLILCLSLTKWVHLNHGDSGLLRLFARITSCLRRGGVVAIELQPWRSYEQARSISRELRAAHAQLRIRPDDFAWLLECIYGLKPCGQVGTGHGYGAWNSAQHVHTN